MGRLWPHEIRMAHYIIQRILRVGKCNPSYLLFYLPGIVKGGALYFYKHSAISIKSN